tara:strand:- start:1755 stop:2567 length:813 start_codon:yes stop_codon:yes gene_type:complete
MAKQTPSKRSFRRTQNRSAPPIGKKKDGGTRRSPRNKRPGEKKSKEKEVSKEQFFDESDAMEVEESCAPSSNSRKRKADENGKRKITRFKEEEKEERAATHKQKRRKVAEKEEPARKRITLTSSFPCGADGCEKQIENLRRVFDKLKKKQSEFDRLLKLKGGDADSFRHKFEEIEKTLKNVEHVNSSVLVVGPSGRGKSHLVNLLVTGGRYSDRPLTSIPKMLGVTSVPQIVRYGDKFRHALEAMDSSLKPSIGFPSNSPISVSYVFSNL